MSDLINIYDKVYENTPKNVFMSMWFSDKTMDTYQTLKDVQEILKRENGIDFRIIKVDEHKDGYSDEIYRRIVDGIDASSFRALFSRLRNFWSNWHEVGNGQASPSVIIGLPKEAFKDAAGMPLFVPKLGL